MTLKSDEIFKEKLTGGLKNDMKNFTNFYDSSCKSKNLLFSGFVWFKAYKFLNEKKSYVS